jgi:hypothetical protein
MDDALHKERAARSRLVIEMKGPDEGVLSAALNFRKNARAKDAPANYSLVTSNQGRRGWPEQVRP